MLFRFYLTKYVQLRIVRRTAALFKLFAAAANTFFVAPWL